MVMDPFAGRLGSIYDGKVMLPCPSAIAHRSPGPTPLEAMTGSAKSRFYTKRWDDRGVQTVRFDANVGSFSARTSRL
jgi:hypothetical protein